MATLRLPTLGPRQGALVTVQRELPRGPESTTVKQRDFGPLFAGPVPPELPFKNRRTRAVRNIPWGEDSDLATRVHRGKRGQATRRMDTILTVGPTDRYVLEQMRVSARSAMTDPLSGKKGVPLLDADGNILGYGGAKTGKPDWMRDPKGGEKDYFEPDDTERVIDGLLAGTVPTTKERRRIADTIGHALYMGEAAEEKYRAFGGYAGPTGPVSDPEGSPTRRADVLEDVDSAPLADGPDVRDLQTSRPRVSLDTESGTLILGPRSPLKGRFSMVNRPRFFTVHDGPRGVVVTPAHTAALAGIFAQACARKGYAAGVYTATSAADAGRQYLAKHGTRNPLTRAETAAVLKTARFDRALALRMPVNSWSRGRYAGRMEAGEVIARTYGVRPRAGSYGVPAMRMPNPLPRIVPELVRSAIARWPDEKGNAWSWVWTYAGPNDRADVDEWLVRTGHPLASQAGTPENRFRQLIAELAPQYHPKGNPVTRAETATVRRAERKAIQAAGIFPSGDTRRGYYAGKADAFDVVARELGPRYRIPKKGARTLRRTFARPGLYTNPPRVVGTIPGRMTRIEYLRTGKDAGRYYHNFKSGVRAVALANGDVLLTGKRRLFVRQ